MCVVDILKCSTEPMSSPPVGHTKHEYATHAELEQRFLPFYAQTNIEDGEKMVLEWKDKRVQKQREEEKTV